MDSHTDNKLSYFTIITALLIFSLIIMAVLNTANQKQRKLKEGFQYAKAKIVDFEKSIDKTSTTTIFVFSINSKKVNGQLESGVFCKLLEETDKSILRNIEFDIVYSLQNPLVSQLLFSEDLYNQYNLEYPTRDSELHNIFETYFQCRWSFWRYLN